MSPRRFVLSSIPALLLLLLISSLDLAQNSSNHSRRALQKSTSTSWNSPAVKLTTGNWSQLARLPAPAQTEFFADSLAISGDTLVVGQQAAVGLKYVAYVYLKPPGVWKAVPPATKLVPGISFDGLYASVAIDSDTVVYGGSNLLGGPGYVFVYVKPASGWPAQMSPTAILTATGTHDNGFASSVSISGDTIVAGDSGTGGTNDPGAAYVFVKPAGGWTDMHQTAKLTPSDGMPSDNFGQAVNINGSTIVVGAPQYQFGSGKGYVFEEPAGGWTDMTQTAELTVSNAVPGVAIGDSIVTDGNMVVAGAPDATLRNPGGVYLFQKPSSGWVNMTPTAVLAPADPQNGGAFGSSVGLSGKYIAVGSPRRGPKPNGLQGGLYIFQEPSGGWQNTITSNLVLTGSDAHSGAALGGGTLAIGPKILVGGAVRVVKPSEVCVFGLP